MPLAVLLPLATLATACSASNPTPEGHPSPTSFIASQTRSLAHRVSADSTAAGSDAAVPSYRVKIDKGTCALQWTHGGTTDAQVGTDMLQLSDVDDDGSHEVVVSDGTQTARMLSGATGAVLHQTTLNAPWRFLSAGDVDGDGLRDALLVTEVCPQSDAGQSDGGVSETPDTGGCVSSLVVLSGKNLSPLGTIAGRAGDVGFASSALVVPDQNGDGLPDIAIGTTTDGSGAGRVAIYSLRSRKPLETLTTPHGSSEIYGTSLTSIGNQDGALSLTVGDPYALTFGGRASTLDVATSALTWSVNDKDGNLLGDRVISPGDLDGDGTDDLVFGVHNFPNGGAVGQILAASGKDGSQLWATEGLRLDMALGLGLASVGDVDGDGHPDVAAGGPKNPVGFLDDGHGGFVEVLSSTGAPLIQMEEVAPPKGALWFGWGLGANIALVKNADASGHFVMAIAAPNAPFGTHQNAGRVMAFSCHI